MPETASVGTLHTRTDAILGRATAALEALPHASPRLEAELLLTEATGWTRTALLAWPERAPSAEAVATFEALLARRLAGEPIAYIRGRQAFWTLELRVTPDTLIPRPETELLVEITLERLDARRPWQLADLGTGSGAIAAAVASERPGWSLIATDRSAPALAVARENFWALGLERIACLRMDWLAALAPDSLDAILSNPPYVAGHDPHLDRGDLRFEPRSALTPGGDGLHAIRTIAAEAGRCLRPGGLLAVEHGFDQGAAARQILTSAGLHAVETQPDLAGLDRVTLGYR
ncbi:peptide chain release factor N(5)-glutamine methyltransferase [Allochromatium palmeri]|uniref:Release factor glutamine methyltransferase n=1 Tax=Allochromatium palmeri TaxID=231048 RepID=A0A6N8ECQ7_9GAMM|nr:peptide chain release factor N(5)-glutamine methyltransferase [Allochromatium palmeri]MTW21361.1 peptide chain release factor N(5)-glutamine methyltransferase [Allochromatium palmeri]